MVDIDSYYRNGKLCDCCKRTKVVPIRSRKGYDRKMAKNIITTK